jgi:hypothetical protein
MSLRRCLYLSLKPVKEKIFFGDNKLERIPPVIYLQKFFGLIFKEISS